MALVVRVDFHCDGSSRVKMTSRSPASSTAVGDGAAFQAPLARERFSMRLDFGRGAGTNHVALLVGQLIMHVLGSIAE